MTNNLNLYNDLIKKHFMSDNSELYNALPVEKRKAEIDRVIAIMKHYNMKDGWIRYDVNTLNVYQGQVEHSAYVTIEELTKKP